MDEKISREEGKGRGLEYKILRIFILRDGVKNYHNFQYG